MGLQEGRREELISAEMTDLDKLRVEERNLERKVTYRNAYARARRVLLIAALLTLGTIWLLPRRWKISFPVTSQISQLLLSYGYQGHLVLGFALATLVGLLILLLWWLSKKHYGWMIVAAVFALIDMAGAPFMLMMSESAINEMNEAAIGSAGVAAGNGLHVGGSAYDFMLVFFIGVFVHLVVIFYCIWGAVKGAKMRKVPESSLEEKSVERLSYDMSEDYTEHPEEGTVSLREVPEASMHLIRAEVAGMKVSVERAYGVTMLAVDGQVYNDQKGGVEPAYCLRALVNGVHFRAEHQPTKYYSLMTLYADDQKIGEKKRRW